MKVKLSSSRWKRDISQGVVADVPKRQPQRVTSFVETPTGILQVRRPFTIGDFLPLN